ncbi:MAG: hypothetical protein OEW48_10705, partial [Phycisphaerae bacterium]|nr:hypothetical protein [Phycisphaerae bacterium]
KVTLILQKWTRPNSIQNYYTISPCGAYFWPKAFTGEFYSKLDKVIERIAEQKKSFNDGYFGFLYLDLHEETIDQRQKATEKQEWEPIIEQHLNQQPFPLVLVTDSTRLQKSFYIMNKAAIETGFVKPRK